jgi:hypothetical protein
VGGTDTFLLGEISVPAITSSGNVNAVNYYDLVVGMPIPSGTFIHVIQAVAQTANQNWQAICFGGDY